MSNYDDLVGNILIGLAIWTLAAVPVAILVGQWLRRSRERYEAALERQEQAVKAYEAQQFEQWEKEVQR